MTTIYQLDAQQWNGTIDAACGPGARKNIETIDEALALLLPYLSAESTADMAYEVWPSGEIAIYTSEEDLDRDGDGSNAAALLVPESVLRDRE